MDQGPFIAGALLAAFVLWLAANNRLNTYTAVLWGPTAAATPTGGNSSSSSSGGSSSTESQVSQGIEAYGAYAALAA